MKHLNFSKKKIILPGTASQLILENRPPPVEPEPSKPTVFGRDYVTPFVKEEEEIYKKFSKMAVSDDKQDNQSHCALSDLDSMTIGTMATTTNEESSNIYRRYDFDTRRSNDLLVYSKRQEILNAINVNRIVIIKGATGCGKTTQVPQFILDDAREKDVHCNIVVTQPRRIAAASVAKRVCEERGWNLGTLVGYQIGLDRKTNEDTRLVYVTTGVLLQKLIKDKDMKEFTHYIIDEIHERNQDMDFLLMVVRNFLNIRSKDARLIVMSATIDTSKFYDYLITYYNEKQFKPHVVDIVEPPRYKILTFYLEDLCWGRNRIVEAVTLLPFVPESPEIKPNAYRTAARIIQELDRVESVNEQSGSCDRKAAVLVFLPGLHEIEEMEKHLKEMSTPAQYASFWIKPLHSSITAEEQQDVFKRPQIGMRKIILSTNIAESSVTVTDIEYVIDFCLTKALVTDQSTGCTSLTLMWASRNSLMQRAGRVGRVAEGRVYRMISKDFYDDQLEQEAVPEILRCPLESLVLKAKLLEMGSPKKILALALDQPDLTNIHQAVAHLKEIGALLLYTADNRYDPCDGQITFMGTVIAHLPLDVRLGKLIFLGNALGVVEECIVMACAMATKNLFSTPYGKYLEAYDAKLAWAESSCSDCIAFLNAYKTWRECTVTRRLTPKQLRDFAKDNFLQKKVLTELSQLEDDIKRRLVHQNLMKIERRRQFQLPGKEVRAVEEAQDIQRPFFLKLAIAGAFYPNYYVRNCQGAQIDEKEILKVLGGQDPLSSVYLQGLPNNQPTQIYKQSIKELFHDITGRVDVNVDNTSKAYITFRRSVTAPEKGAIPGKIEMSVYRAIKMRQTEVKFAIPRLKNEEAETIYEEYVQRNKLGNSEFTKKMNLLVWPWKRAPKDDKIGLANELLEVRISHVETPQKFWVQSSMRIILNLIGRMLKALNTDEDALKKYPSDANLPIGSVHAASLRYESDAYHRCRIISRKPKKRKEPIEYTYTVYFIDYGSSQTDLPADEIYDIAPEIRREFCIDQLPDLALECALVKLRPIGKKSVNEPSQMIWDKKACSILESISRRPTVVKIYSIVNNVLRVKLVLPDKNNEEYNFKNTINYDLIRRNLAEKMDEDYISLFYREEVKMYRNNVKNRKSCEEPVFQSFEDEEAECENEVDDCKHLVETSNSVNTSPSTDTPDDLTFDDIKLPENPDNRTKLFLKGPFSPLEMKVTSLTAATTTKLVKITKDSVNSVLLDTDPSDPKARMLVAVSVGTNPSGDKLNLTHTTIMPNLPALPMLCCLVFSPMVELRCDPKYMKYCGAVCGLGYDRNTRQSLFPANDIEIVFDFEIDERIIELVNKIRFRLNLAVTSSTDPIEETRQRLKTYLLELFLQRKYELQQTHTTIDNYRWGLIEDERLRCPSNASLNKHPAENSGMAYSLIWAVSRAGDVEKELKAVLNNLHMLELFAKKQLSQNTIECDLCRTTLDNPASANMHLKQAAHRAREKRYHRLMNVDATQRNDAT